MTCPQGCLRLPGHPGFHTTHPEMAKLEDERIAAGLRSVSPSSLILKNLVEGGAQHGEVMGHGRGLEHLHATSPEGDLVCRPLIGGMVRVTYPKPPSPGEPTGYRPPNPR